MGQLGCSGSAGAESLVPTGAGEAAQGPGLAGDLPGSQWICATDSCATSGDALLADVVKASLDKR